MEIFTDGTETMENPEQTENDGSEIFESEPEITEPETTPSPTIPPDHQEEIEMVQDSGTDESGEQVDIHEDSSTSYEELLAVLTEQRDEIKTIHELEEKKQEYFSSYQNMGITLIVGIGLLCGCVCALILSNYLRHG